MCIRDSGLVRCKSQVQESSSSTRASTRVKYKYKSQVQFQESSTVQESRARSSTSVNSPSVKCSNLPFYIFYDRRYNCASPKFNAALPADLKRIMKFFHELAFDSCYPRLNLCFILELDLFKSNSGMRYELNIINNWEIRHHNADWSNTMKWSSMTLPTYTLLLYGIATVDADICEPSFR